VIHQRILLTSPTFAHFTINSFLFVTTIKYSNANQFDEPVVAVLFKLQQALKTPAVAGFQGLLDVIDIVDKLLD